MIYLISAALIILGSVIIIFFISLTNDKENSEKMDKKQGLFFFLLDFTTTILGMGNVLLPIGLIFLGILLLCRRQVEFYTFCLFAFYTSAENTLFRCFIR